MNNPYDAAARRPPAPGFPPAPAPQQPQAAVPQVTPSRGYDPPDAASRYAAPEEPRKVAPPVPVVTDEDDDRGQPPSISLNSALPTVLPPSIAPVSKAPQLPTAKRVPGDLPFVIRPRFGWWLLRYLLPVALLITPAILLLTTGHVFGALALLVVGFSIYLIAFGFRVFSQVAGGPFLAADRDGIWLRARKWPVLATQIPWELVAEIRTKRWLFDKVLVVVPRDQRAGKLTGAWGAIDQARTTAFFGSALVASVAFGDTSARDALRALTELSYGRARVERTD